jgi:hypothetical protein
MTDLNRDIAPNELRPSLAKIEFLILQIEMNCDSFNLIRAYRNFGSGASNTPFDPVLPPRITPRKIYPQKLLFIQINTSGFNLMHIDGYYFTRVLELDNTRTKKGLAGKILDGGCLSIK